MQFNVSTPPSATLGDPSVSRSRLLCDLSRSDEVPDPSRGERRAPQQVAPAMPPAPGSDADGEDAVEESGARGCSRTGPA